MLSGESVVIMFCHESENPIEKWKKIIGKSDPVEAKVFIFNLFEHHFLFFH
jgi:hypothetical protein